MASNFSRPSGSSVIDQNTNLHVMGCVLTFQDVYIIFSKNILIILERCPKHAQFGLSAVSP